MGLILRRCLGATLLAATYVPLHRLLDPARNGVAGSATRQAAEAAWSAGLYGTLIVAGLALAASLLLPMEALTRWGSRLTSSVVSVPASVFGVGIGACAFGLSAVAARVLFHGLPTSVDEMVQLLHARALLEGALALPLPAGAEAWAVQNGVMTATGWVSIYPPGHTVLLALGLAAGMAWVVGPVAIGAGTVLTYDALRRIGPEGIARFTAILLAVTPFWLLLGATHLSHATAAAAITLVFWSAVRARSGGTAWLLLTGAAIGLAVCIRPWTGVALSAGLVVALWLPGPDVRIARRLGLTVLGGAPFAALLFAWNTRLFGGPTRLGYSVAFGPAHGLGLHTDPWGNSYGFADAVAYTAADLVQMGAHLLESPLPAVAVVGVALLARGMPAVARPLVAWIGAGITAAALYWHHGIHMGPRMLFETTPAWVGLFVTAAWLIATTKVGSVRAWTAWSMVFGLAGSVLLAPSVITARGTTAEAVRVTTVPTPPSDAPALVFVHGGWPSRVAARLAAGGVRRDSIETALRRNDICDVDAYARWRLGGAAGPMPTAPLDWDPRPGSPATLSLIALAPGLSVRVAAGRRPDDACAREARADRLGVLELEPLLWQAPPTAGTRVIVARDMGPIANQVVMAALGRQAWVYVDLGVGASAEGGLRLLDYAEGMELLWGSAAGVSPGGG